MATTAALRVGQVALVVTRRHWLDSVVLSVLEVVLVVFDYWELLVVMLDVILSSFIWGVLLAPLVALVGAILVVCAGLLLPATSCVTEECRKGGERVSDRLREWGEVRLGNVLDEWSAFWRLSDAASISDSQDAVVILKLYRSQLTVLEMRVKLVSGVHALWHR